MKQKLLRMTVLMAMLPLVGCGGWRLTGQEFLAESQVSPSHFKEVLALRGVGVKTLFMIKVFIAGFYLPPSVSSSDALNTNVAKNLSVRFYTQFSSKDFVNFTLNNIKPNISRQEYDSLQAEFKRMAEISPAISSGDTLALFYEPGIGTSFIHNGQNKGTIAGELFSKAIFSTWIGPKPFDHIVKRQILGIKSHKGGS